MKRFNYVLIVLLFFMNLKVLSQEHKKNDWIIKLICQEIEVDKLQYSIHKNGYSFYKLLVEDSIIRSEDVLCDSIILFAKKEDRIRKKTSDFTLEILNVISNRIQVEQNLERVLNYTSYEKPPKIILMKEEKLIIFQAGERFIGITFIK